jgi:hypothetical protein
MAAARSYNIRAVPYQYYGYRCTTLRRRVGSGTWGPGKPRLSQLGSFGGGEARAVARGLTLRVRVLRWVVRERRGGKGMYVTSKYFI